MGSMMDARVCSNVDTPVGLALSGLGSLYPDHYFKGRYLNLQANLLDGIWAIRRSRFPFRKSGLI